MTPLGNLVTDIDRDGNTVTVRMNARDGVRLVSSFDDGTVTYRAGRRLPAKGDEAMVDGTTVEVSSVGTDPDGTSWVVGGGVKHIWR